MNGARDGPGRDSGEERSGVRDSGEERGDGRHVGAERSDGRDRETREGRTDPAAGTGQQQQDGTGCECSRRRLLRGSALAGALSMSGCSGLFGSGSAGTEAPGSAANGTRSVPTGPATFAPESTATAAVDEERIEETLSSLSLAEKVGQTTQLEPKGAARPFSVDRAADLVADHAVGSVLFGGANAPGRSAREAAKYFNELQSTALDEVGVPLLVGIDAVHGNATVREAVAFPHQVGLGATWDTALAGEVASATARSVAAMGANWTFSPVADVAHDPRWGRYYESFGEDPFHAGRFVAAMVAGYERVSNGSKSVAASVKHFAGYSMPETGDDREPADVSTRTLRDVVLPPFRAGVDAGAETVMANSGSVNGVPAHASEWLATTTLRERWGFDGLLVSDWRDIHRFVGMHGYATDFREAVELAVTAGVDMYMAPHVQEVEEYQSALTGLVESGTVPESRLDEMVRRVLRVKEGLGLFDAATVPVDRHTAVARESDRDLARRAAAESLTLLVDDAVVPFDEDVSSVLVTGPLADSGRRLLGGWTTAWQGAPRDAVPETVTVAAGVEAAAPDGVDVSTLATADESFQRTEEVTTAADQADAVVAVLGEEPYAEGQGDIDDLSLPDGQGELVAALRGRETPTVGVIVTGRPRGSPSLFDGLDAAMLAPLPGSEGGTAVGAALFGDRDPAGRLPFTWPRHTGGIPDVISHPTPPDSIDESGRSGSDRAGPLFPFGHGGGYVGVSYDSLSLAPATVTSVARRERVRATVEVTDPADRPTEEVVVLLANYDNEASPAAGPAVPPARQVVGFTRVALDPGESRRVRVPVSLRALGVTGGDVTGRGERVVPAGAYTLTTAGRSVEGSATLRIEETATVPDPS